MVVECDTLCCDTSYSTERLYLQALGLEALFAMLYQLADRYLGYHARISPTILASFLHSGGSIAIHSRVDGDSRISRIDQGMVDAILIADNSGG